MEADLVAKERHSKKNLFSALSSSNGNVILILLTEVVVFYIEFSVVYIWEIGFQVFILGLFKDDKSLSLQNNLKNPL